jgi:hydrogenase nickel incorporation protein HypA/HybF
VHELALAESVVRIAAGHAAGRRVATVELKVGHLRQVVPGALAFAFQLVSEGAAVEGAELVMEEIPPAGRCRACGIESELAGFPLCCPACGGLDVELVRGEELLVDALELEEDAWTTNGGTRNGR